jgi:hypothetical protein
MSIERVKYKYSVAVLVQQLALLSERRQALITAAVTGGSSV